MYLKEKYNQASIFEQTKVVYSLFKDSFIGSLSKDLKNKILFDQIDDNHLSLIDTPNAKNLNKLAIQYSDYVDITKSFNNKDICISYMNEIAKELEILFRNLVSFNVL